MRDREYFFCYDRELFDVLSYNGFRFITKARNVNDGRIFSLYKRTEELDKVIYKWTDNKQ